jgi:hypothetical protein
MRSDMRALLKMLGASFLIAGVVMGILATAALDALSRDVAIYLALAVMVVGGLAIRRLFGPALLRRNRDAGERDAPPDRPRQ